MSSLVSPSAETLRQATSTQIQDLKEEKDLPEEASKAMPTPDTIVPVPVVAVTETKSEGAASIIPKNDFIRVKKRKVVILLSYCGQGYLGMQRNPGTRTIEGDFFDALLKNNYIDEEYVQRPFLMSFQRAARTDKNVSAARQIVSIKAPENLELSKVNEALPPAIRVMGMKRVTRGFDSKINCDARTYSYMIPTFAFAPVDEIVTEAYRISPSVLEEVRKTLALYLGAKNFHNFTSRKRFNDPSAIRFIMSFGASDPFEKDGLEYVILRVKGQSFMLHQIRKMIGLVTAIMRGFATVDIFEKAWGSSRIDIPRAPGVGLMLDEVHYQRYDERYGKDGVHEPLTWEEHKADVEKFCDEHIYPIVTKTENEEKSMMNWLSTLAYHSYDVREHETGNETSKIGAAFMKAGRFSGKNKALDDDDEDQEDEDDEESNSSSGKTKRQKT
jgi:tRNA pseudouridine38-40 synthase